LETHEEPPRRLSPTRLLTGLLVAVTLILIPLLYLNILFSVLDDLDNKEWGGADFTAYYTAAKLIRNGISPYNEAAFGNEAQSLGFRNDRPYIYVPLLAISLIPLTLLPPREAAAVWFTANVVLLVISTLLMVRTLGIQKHKIAVVALLLAVLTFYPAVFSIFVGQANVLLLALVILTWHLAKRGSDELAGISIAAASLVKIFPFCIAVYFLWKGRYRSFVFALSALVILTAFSVAIVGLEPHVTYVSSVLPTQLVKPHPLNQSLSSFLYRTIQPDQPRVLVLWQLASLSASALVVLGTVLLIPRTSRDAAFLDLEFALVVVSMLLVSTVSWIGTLTLLVLPFGVATKEIILYGRRKDARLALIMTGVSFSCVNSQRVVEWYITTGSVVGPLASGLLSMPLYGMIVLWCTVGYLLFRCRGSHFTQSDDVEPSA
jgi:hypothetical protein